MNAIAISPAVISTMGEPWNETGISLSAIFFTLFLQQIYYRIILSINCAKLQQCLGILYPLTDFRQLLCKVLLFHNKK